MNITIDRTDATAAVAGRELPFAIAGTDVRGSKTAHDVMEAANLLNWNVHLRELQTVPKTEQILTMDGVTTKIVEPAIPVARQFASVRTNPITGRLQAVGVVGNVYTPKQNEQLAGILDAFATESGGEFVAAGDFYGKGKTVFFTIALPKSVLIGGKDRMDHYLSVFTSHDGSGSIAFVVHNMRVACANARNTLLRSEDVSTLIRHTASADAKLAKVRHDLNIAWKQAEKFDALAEKLMGIKTTDSQFDEIVAKVFDEPGKVLAKRGETIKANRNYALKEILHGPTNTGIDGTAWAAFNAVTEWQQHGHKDAATNANRALTSRTNQLRADRVAEMLLALA